MKVLESQNAVLTNFEVYQHLTNQRKEDDKRRRPGNLKMLVRELLNFLTTHPSPLSQQPMAYNEKAISQLIERLYPYKLSKGEVLMVLNLRPTTPATLGAIVDEMESRFDEDKQLAIIGIVTDVLGRFPPREEAMNIEGADGEAADGVGESAVQSVETA